MIVCVNSEVICRYDRLDEFEGDDAAAILAGYCNPQYESVEGAMKAGMWVCGSVGDRTAKRWVVSRWVEERIVWPPAFLPDSSAASVKLDAARGRLSFFFRFYGMFGYWGGGGARSDLGRGFPPRGRQARFLISSR